MKKQEPHQESHIKRMTVNIPPRELGCPFRDYDFYNSNPIKPKRKCVLYSAMRREKPDCSKCGIKNVVVEMKEDKLEKDPDKYKKLTEIIDGFREAKRVGSDIDVPEGSRYIEISETALNNITNELIKVRDDLRN